MLTARIYDTYYNIAVIPIYTQLFVIFTTIKVVQPQSHTLMKRFIWKHVKSKIQYYSIAKDWLRITNVNIEFNRKEPYTLKPFRESVTIFSYG